MMADTNTNNNKEKNQESNNRVVTDDVIFNTISDLHAPQSWGRCLDAGTGLHSLQWWVHNIPFDSLVAVTASESMQKNVQRQVKALLLNHPESNNSNITIARGNWFPTKKIDSLAHLGRFDTILLDYLIGAMDGFSPYRQDEIIPLLANRHLTPTGRLYICGMEPIADSAPLLGKVRRTRDACILLAGHKCYREYPATWIERQVDKVTCLRRVGTTTQFPIVYRHATVCKQINVGRSKLALMPAGIETAMRNQLDELEEESLVLTKTYGGSFTQGFDYLVVAERCCDDNDENQQRSDETQAS